MKGRMVKMKLAVGVLLALLVLAAIVAACMVGRRNRAVGAAERAVDAGSNEVRRVDGVPAQARFKEAHGPGGKNSPCGGGGAGVGG